MFRRTRDLRKQLRKAVVDHVSDSFLETNLPLTMLIQAAESSNENDTRQCAVLFDQHAKKLVEVCDNAYPVVSD